MQILILNNLNCCVVQLFSLWSIRAVRIAFTEKLTLPADTGYVLYFSAMVDKKMVYRINDS